jgi:hypothetical protein
MAYKQGTVIKQIGISEQLNILLERDCKLLNLSVNKYIEKIIIDKYQTELLKGDVNNEKKGI